MNAPGSCRALSLAIGIVLAACTRKAPDEIGPPIPTLLGKRCVLHLHGKSGRGAPTLVDGDGVSHLHPSGNGEGWGGRQWLYFPESEYASVRKIVAATIAASGCDKLVIRGFSNGGAAAAKLYCRGERFGGHVVGYVVDDPVVDHGVEGCKPPTGVRLKLYWSGALTEAVDGWACKQQDWTCEGGSTIGITRYAALLGTSPTRSAQTVHAEYLDAPELRIWLVP